MTPTSSDEHVASLSRWQIILLLQGMALLVGLAMPITPSKTGSDASLAEWFVDDPGYLLEVFVYFVLTNALLGLLLLAGWLHYLVRTARASDRAGSDTAADAKD